jgi:hypothetical protein
LYSEAWRTNGILSVVSFFLYEVGTALNRRYLIAEPFMCAALLSPNLVSLMVDLDPPAGHSVPVLLKLLQTFPRLTMLLLCRAVIPSQVLRSRDSRGHHSLSHSPFRGSAHYPLSNSCSTTVYPNASSRATMHSQLRSLTVYAGDTTPGGLASITCFGTYAPSKVGQAEAA